MASSFETLARNAIASAIGIVSIAVLATVAPATSATIALALDESPAGSAAAATPAAPMPPAPDTMKVVPSDEGEAPPAAGASGAPTAKPATHRTHHHVASRPPEVEPVPPGTRLKIIQDGWIYAGPSKSSKHIQKTTIGKFVNVSGSTKYYLQVQLKSGETGYIPPAEVELVKPVDKVFILTQDTPVLDAPNRWAKKLAEVHRSRSVHVIGLALNYMRIRMKSGIEGYISATALQ